MLEKLDLEYARWSNFSYRCASHRTLNLLPDRGLPVGTGKAQLFRCKTPVLIVPPKTRCRKSEGLAQTEGRTR
jgi:hypothetical protein